MVGIKHTTIHFTGVWILINRLDWRTIINNPAAGEPEIVRTGGSACQGGLDFDLRRHSLSHHLGWLLPDAAAVGIGSAVVHGVRRVSSTATEAIAIVVVTTAITADAIAAIVTEKSTSSHWEDYWRSWRT